MQEFIDRLKKDREEEIKEYMKTGDKNILKNIFIIQNIITNISQENQYSESSNLIKEMTQEVSKMDLSKIDMTDLFNQLGVK